MKKILLIGILISNISYGASTRQAPVSAKCWCIKEATFAESWIDYCEMTNGDVCYITGRGISCFKN